MAPTIPSDKLTLTYPLFAADFFDDNPSRLAVAGGGGESRTGVGNKITILDTSVSPPQVITELELSRSEDAPMSLATVSTSSPAVSYLLAGINSSETSVASLEENQHFRVFSFITSNQPTLTHTKKQQLFSTATARVADSYQRVMRRHGTIAALASGGGGGLKGSSENEIVVVGLPGTPEWGTGVRVLERVVPGQTELSEDTRGKDEGKEAVDLDVSDHTGGEGEIDSQRECAWSLVYCHPSTLYLHQPPKTASSLVLDEREKREGEGVSETVYVRGQGTGQFRAVRWLRFGQARARVVVATVNLPARSGAELLVIDVVTRKVLAARALHRGIKAAISLDAVTLPGGQSIIAVSGADQSVEILCVDVSFPPSKPGTSSSSSSSSGTGHKSPTAAHIRTVKTFKDVHPFQITKVAFSAPVRNNNNKKLPHLNLASVSMGNTIVVHKLPLYPDGPEDERLLLLPPPSGRIRRALTSTLASVLFSLLTVVLLAIALQLIFVRRADGIDALERLIGRTEGEMHAIHQRKSPQIVVKDVPDVRKEEGMEGGEAQDIGDVVLGVVREGAEVAGEWVLDESRKVGAGVVKGVVRGAVEEVVGGIVRG